MVNKNVFFYLWKKANHLFLLLTNIKDSKAIKNQIEDLEGTFVNKNELEWNNKKWPIDHFG